MNRTQNTHAITCVITDADGISILLSAYLRNFPSF